MQGGDQIFAHKNRVYMFGATDINNCNNDNQFSISISLNQPQRTAQMHIHQQQYRTLVVQLTTVSLLQPNTHNKSSRSLGVTVSFSDTPICKQHNTVPPGSG